MSASISSEPLGRSSRQLVRRSHVLVARSISGGVAIRYALPVLWMTSRLAVVGRMAAVAILGRSLMLSEDVVNFSTLCSFENSLNSVDFSRFLTFS